MSSSQFVLGNETTQVSGSNGVISIQGNVTMSSDVRIEGGLTVGAFPSLIPPSDDHLFGYWSFILRTVFIHKVH